MCQPTRQGREAAWMPSLPSGCRSELLPQRHCLWLVTHAGSSMHVAWCQDDLDNQKKWHGPCCQSSSSHRWPKQNHLKTVFWSYGTKIKTEYFWQEDLPLAGGAWLKWDNEWWRCSPSWSYVGYTSVCLCQKWSNWDFPGGPVVKTLPSSAGGAGLIPDRVTKIPHASRAKAQNIKQKQHCNRADKVFKNGPHQKNKIIFNKKVIKLYILFVSL